MNDSEVLHNIDALVAEEHRLRQQHPDGLDEGELARLQHLEVQLDEAWDLLRQRRARREAGLDPDQAKERGEDVVEGYRQ